MYNEHEGKPGSVIVSESPEAYILCRGKEEQREIWIGSRGLLRSSDYASGALALTIGVQHDHAAGCVTPETIRGSEGGRLVFCAFR